MTTKFHCHREEQRDVANQNGNGNKPSIIVKPDKAVATWQSHQQDVKT